MRTNSSACNFGAGIAAALFLAILWVPSVSAQLCPANPITLSTQAEVTDFQTTHGPCDTLIDDLTISGNDISDLSALSGLTTAAVPARIAISGNPILTQLDGLSGLTGMYWLDILNNATLANIDGLSNVTTSIGPVIISGNPLLTNVNGLSGLTVLQFGALFLENNPSLTDISGVSGITSIGASLGINNNDALLNLDALAGLTNVASNISISDNAALASISGLSALAAGFNETLYVQRNPSLPNLQGLEGLTEVSGLVIHNNVLLTNLDPLSNLRSVGDTTALAITYNTALTSIDGLAGVESVAFDFILSNNTALSLCSVLETLLDDVDDFLPGPGPGPDGIPDVGGEVTVEVNADGCNSIEEITGAAPPPEPPVEPPSPPPPTSGPVVPVPALGWNALALLALLILAGGLAGVRRHG